LRVLLDTHALFWALEGGQRLSSRAIDVIGDAAADLLVSAVSAYEICFKHSLGKLAEASSLAENFEAEIASLQVNWLPVLPAHAIRAGKLDLIHRDPLDRLLVAQAMVESVPVVSNEALFDRYGVERIW
jgi:PIN domain nuclease of toxin-antitoxin system